MLDESMNTDEIISRILEYIDNMYLDYFTEHKDIYYNYFLSSLKAILPYACILAGVLMITCFLLYRNERHIENKIGIRRYRLRASIDGFVLCSILSLLMFMTVTQTANKAVADTYEMTINNMENHKSDIEKLEIISKEDMVNVIRTHAVSFAKDIDIFQHITELAFILNLTVITVFYVGLLFMLIESVCYITMISSKQYKRFKYVL